MGELKRYKHYVVYFSGKGDATISHHLLFNCRIAEEFITEQIELVKEKYKPQGYEFDSWIQHEDTWQDMNGAMQEELPEKIWGLKLKGVPKDA